MQRLALLCAATALAATATAQFNVVIPAGYNTAVENSANNFPFGFTFAGSTWGGLRIQHIYDSTHFTSQGITYPILVNGLRWRADDVATTTTWTGGTYSQCTIQMSTAPIDHTLATTTYATNHGANLATVHNGAVVVSPGAGSGVGVPSAFHVNVPLATTFLYDPNQGDLVVEVDLPTGTWGGGSLRSLASVAGTTTTPPPFPALARRVYGSAAYPNPNGIDQNILVMQVDYVPANGLYSAFTSNVTGGPSPLAVQFTDLTYTSAPGGITSWSWDLNGDGIPDSAVQNPSYVYNTCGTYNVSLTTTDGVNPPSTITRTAYITTDAIQASWTHQLIAPTVVQFTDTSNMPATSWSWDLTGDGIPDSNVQNPAFAYPTNNPVTVSLTVTRLCAPPSTFTKTIVPLPELATGFAGGNNGASLWTVYFDANVTNPQGLNMRTLAVNTTSAAATPFTLDVFVKDGSYFGNTSTPAVWRLAGTASGTSSTPNTPSYATLAAPVYLPPGQFGIALRYNGIAPSYTNGNGTSTPGSGTNQTFGNADLTLLLGAAQATTTAPFVGGTPFQPRVWNGAIFYDTNGFNGAAGYGFFAPGCPGSLGITNVVNTSQPTLGGTLNVDLNNLPFGLALMLVGTSNTISGFGPLPLDLTPLGAPGCSLRVSLDATATVLGAGNTATWSLPIPNTPTLVGAQLYNQAAVFDPATNAFGFVTSDAAAWIVGV